MIELSKVDTHHVETHVLQGGDGPDLLFLHGAGGVTPEDPFLAKLGERFRVHAPLLPGYGESPEAPNIRDMLDVTLHSWDVAEALGLEKPILAGHSMGGMIAAEMAAIAPNDCDRLALIAPVGLWLDDHPIPDIFSLLPFEYPPLLFHDEEMGTQLMTAGVDLEDPEFLQGFLVQNARQLGMAGKILFPIPERGLSERLYRIKARTLLIWGDNDKLVPAGPYAQAFKKALANAELVSIPEAGHMVTLEAPDRVVEALERLA